MARNYAALPHDYLEELADLTDEEMGRLVRVLLKYSKSGEERELTGNERFLWRRVRAQEDRFQDSYESTTSSRSEAGKKGAAKRWKDKVESSEMANNNKPQQTIANDSKAITGDGNEWQSMANDNIAIDPECEIASSGFGEIAQNTNQNSEKNIAKYSKLWQGMANDNKPWQKIAKHGNTETETETETILPLASASREEAKTRVRAAAGSLPKKRYGRFVELTSDEYFSLSREFGGALILRDHINEVDVAENAGVDFYALLRERRNHDSQRKKASGGDSS